MEELIKNMMFDINYHPLYFITAHQSRIESGKIILLYNLHKKKLLIVGIMSGHLIEH